MPVVRSNEAVLGSAASCSTYSGLPAEWGDNEKSGMIKIKGGDFLLGTNTGYPEERPQLKTHIQPFWIDRTEVTVAQFSDFVKATGYVTEAEREGGGAVFRIPKKEELKQLLYPWWQYRKGANWRHPEGPGSEAIANHPATLVTFKDAQAYAIWLGRDLAAEAEWEYAAKAGILDNPDIEKEPRDAQGKPQANFWQGHFPLVNTDEDGHQGAAPVGCYSANGFGLFDMVGNVWEQTKELYSPSHDSAPQPTHQQSAPKPNQSMVIKGGSHLCAQDYCVRYRPSAREAHEANLPMSHVGFRTVWREHDEKPDWFSSLWSWFNAICCA